MDINRNNSHSRGNQPSRRSRNFNLEKQSAEKNVSDPLFVNHAEIAWHERRRAWVGDNSRKLKRRPSKSIMSWTTTYDDLLSSTEPFNQPIPLAETVDFLVDIWLGEGLYD